MAQEATREALLEHNAQQAAQIAEQSAQIKLLIEENATLKKRIEKLEREVKRYVAPHSREQPKADPKPSGRRAGQGTFSFKRAPAPEAITRIIHVEPPNICRFCQTPLNPAAFKTDLAFITELPRVQPEITQYVVPVTLCPKCGKEARGEHPDLCRTQRGATSHRLGPRLMAAAQYLHHGLGLPERKVPEVLRSLCGVEVTQSALNQATSRTTTAGTPMATAYQQIKTAIQSAAIVHQDDTGWRIHGVQAWLQVACTPQQVLFQIRTRHTHEQLKELLGEAFRGTLVADRYNVYDHAAFKGFKHHKCIHHVIRNAQEAIVLQEARRGRGIVYATRVLQAFQDAHALHRQLRRKEISLEQYRVRGFVLKRRVTRLLERVPLQSKVNERLRKGLLKHHRRGNLLRFLEDPSIPPTNNAAERALRSGVTARKVSQCSKTQQGADGYAMIKSVLETAKRQGQPPLEVLTSLQARAAPR